jgi:hypothetical protein
MTVPTAIQNDQILSAMPSEAEMTIASVMRGALTRKQGLLRNSGAKSLSMF